MIFFFLSKLLVSWSFFSFLSCAFSFPVKGDINQPLRRISGAGPNELVNFSHYQHLCKLLPLHTTAVHYYRHTCCLRC